MIFTSLVLFYITFLAPKETLPLNYQSVQSVSCDTLNHLERTLGVTMDYLRLSLGVLPL